MAEVVVDALLDGPGTFTGADMSTKLKLLGVDVASFGDAFATTADSLELVYSDAVAGVYKKLVLSEDGTRLLGGILVGDASAYGVLRPMVSSGLALPDNPEQLILPVGTGAGVQLGMPDEAQVCSCNDVTKADILHAVTEQGCATDLAQSVAAVKQCTRAGSTCGSCVPTVKNLVEEHFASVGKVVDKGLCEHFRLTRQELFDVVAVHGYRRFDDIVEAHGTGRGCDICKPAVASILASQTSTHILERETAGLQDTNDAYLANIQRNGTYSVVPRIPGGEITPEKLIVIGEVARDFDLYTKITGGQRIDRTATWIDQLAGGLDRVREVVVDDALGLGADLEAEMARHVGGYEDEWRATLEDPEKLARFVSFVNAPDTPDPSIAFTTERDQIQPIAPALIPVGAPS